MIDQYNEKQTPVGVNVLEKGVISPELSGIYDNVIVKKQFLNLAPTLAQQLILCDEILKAGKQMGRGGPGGAMPPGMPGM